MVEEDILIVFGKFIEEVRKGGGVFSERFHEGFLKRCGDFGSMACVDLIQRLG